MKKLLLGTIGLVALALTGPAVAADFPAYSKAPSPMMPALYDWSGLYIGVNAGGGWSHECWSLARNSANVLLTPPVPEGCHNATGGTVGGQFGYRLQSDSWVFGVETQGNWSNFKGSNTNQFFVGPPAITDKTQVDGFMTFTGQVGYAWNTVLGYVKGGGVVASDRFATYTLPGNVLVDRVGDTRWGGVVGAGLEYSFAPNWSAAVEYNHMFMGTKSVTAVTPTGVFNASDRIGQDMDVVTARVNYRWGGPVVAKY